MNTVWSEANLFFFYLYMFLAPSEHLQHLPDLELVIMAVTGHVVDVYLRLMVTIQFLFPA